jgi:hypothetical protein
MMKTTLSTAAAVCAVAALTTTSDRADACGGCFVPPSENTVVSGHRMVLSVSSTQTVLWDQIEYSGNPAEFAWVLPVKSGAYIELASDAWFETLEAVTSVTISPPPVICGGSSGGIGCGSSDEAGGDLTAGRGEADPVQVLHEGTVGPYETVTVATDTPGALNDWLTEHGYGVDESTQPIIDAYVEEGFDFIALRLQPNAGVKLMKPVRVVTPGAAPALPLRMVAAGTGAEVAVVLYVIGEGRWAPDNFPTTSIPIDLLSWNFANTQSNYAVLRDKALGIDGGRGWLSTFAIQGALFMSFSNPQSFAPPTRFVDLYTTQALANGEISAAGCTLPDMSQETQQVVDPCPGVAWDDPSCAASVDGVSARELVCEDLDDLATALVGMHPRDVWVTRLEANLPRAALGTDLTLAPAEHQGQVDNRLTARVAVGAEEFCGAATPVRFDPAARGRTQVLILGAGLLALLAAFARRRSRLHARAA